jgi:RHS repeat-associated protein
MPGRRIVGGYRYQYQGQEVDPETGKEAFQLRLWDGRIGRWLTTDPAGQYSSPYLGMGNNPTNGTDPDGAFWEEFGNWFSGNGWNTNGALDFQANGGILGDWVGNKFTGYRKGFGDGSNGEIVIAVFRAKEDNIHLANVSMYSTPQSSADRNFPVDFIGGVKDFTEQYNVMKKQNFANSDKYFHSKANFNATLRGSGGEYAAEKLSNLREIFDQNFKGDSREESLEDQKANKYGRERARHYRIHNIKKIDYKKAIPEYRKNRLLDERGF